MLEEALYGYTAAVETAFREASRRQARTRGGLVELRNRGEHLRHLVEQIEGGSEFKTLVEETRSAFCNDWHRSKSESSWRRAIRNFFRRTGYYNHAFSGAATPSMLPRGYETAFLRRHVQTTYLAPVEFVDFPKAKPELKFSDFQIRRLERNELEAIVGNEVNRVFYPYATIDTGALQGYWFIVATSHEDAPRLGRIVVDLSAIGRVSREYSRLPSAVERVLARLVLFDWVVEPEDDHCPYGSQFGFNIPFVIRVTDDPLSGPRGAPDCSKLATTPQIDPYTEEEYETPIVFFELSESHVVSFEECTRRADDCLRQLETDTARWPFLKVATGNLIKAFFADGLEELLWHITALEALLGERRQGLAASLARRVSAILGTTEKERKDLRKRFNDLYDLRCALVHGNELKDDVQWHQLFEARTIARRVTIWFVHYLARLPPESTMDPGRATFQNARTFSASWT